MMFALARDLGGKRVLEIGCGDGVTSVELAYCRAFVHGIDISPCSIDVARQRAALQGLEASFDVVNVVEADSFGEESYDVVWCEAVLHHLVEPLDAVVQKIERCLRPGGQFIAYEPIVYARWLRRLRDLIPVPGELTPDERPLGKSEFAIIRKHFPDLQMRYYRVLRADRFTRNLSVLRPLARIDDSLLRIPGVSSLAGNVVMWSTKQ
jgi:2-polyprenyl-3-methyl-5-hydroxy-6-metoxy-1,4-benzoquinol methylase